MNLVPSHVLYASLSNLTDTRAALKAAIKKNRVGVLIKKINFFEILNQLIEARVSV